MLSGLKLSTICENQKLFEYVLTGSENLDKILGGGIRTAALTEVFGDTGCGKTQFCIELMLNTLFTLDGDVIYVCTKNCLSPDNVNNKISRYVDTLNRDGNNSTVTIESVLQRIKFKRVFELNELIFIVYHIREVVEHFYNHKPVKLIIIDSLTHFLRDQPPLERIRISYELAGVLENIAVKFNCAVLITTDMSVKIQENSFIMILKPMLGDTFAHRPNQRIELQRNRKNNTMLAVVWKNLNGQGGAARYRIDEEKGVVDIE